MNKGSWKRKKWLIKNLTFPQLVKYFFVKKQVISEEDMVEYDIMPYEVDQDIEIGSVGTILIKPSGICRMKEIFTELEKAGITVMKGVRINNYRKYARSVFYMVSPKEQNIWFLILDKYYNESNNMAILLYLDKDIEEIAKLKQHIRKLIGIEFFQVQKGADSYITSLTPIHSSNKKERVYEENAINKLLFANEAEFIAQEVLKCYDSDIIK